MLKFHGNRTLDFYFSSKNLMMAVKPLVFDVVDQSVG